MSNEVTVTTGLQVRNGTLIATNPSESKRFDQTTARGDGPGTVTIGTSEETIDFGDIAPGWMEIKNLDATNFVDLGFSTGVYGIRLIPNGRALFYMVPGSTVYALADTANCDIQIRAFTV